MCLGLLAWTVARLGPARIARTAGAAHPGWLALSLLPVVGRYAVWSWKWARMLRRRAPVAGSHVARALMAGAFVNFTTPTGKLGGGVLRAALVARRTRWRFREAYGWSLADQITNVAADAALLGLLLAVAGSTLGALSLGPATLLLGAAGGVPAVLLLTSRTWAWRAVARPAWLRALLEPLLQIGGARTMAGDLALAAVSRCGLLLSNAMVLRALGVDAPLAQVSLALVVGYVVGTLGPVGGLGVTELALIELYRGIGMSGEVAAAGALLQRAGYYLVTLLWGGWALAREGGAAGLRELRSAESPGAGAGGPPLRSPGP